MERTGISRVDLITVMAMAASTPQGLASCLVISEYLTLSRCSINSYRNYWLKMIACFDLQRNVTMKTTDQILVFLVN